MRQETWGIGLRILSGLLFTLMIASIKAIGDGAALGQVVFFRSAVAVVPLVLFLWWRAEFPAGLATRRPWGHLRRCVLGGAAMFTSFASLRFLPIAEATMLAYLSPVMVVALAATLLGERAGPRSWLGVVLGLAGVAALTVPRFGAGEAHLIGIALGVATAALTAGALIQLRALAVSENPGAIAFYFALFSAIAGLATWPFGWLPVDGTTLVLLVLSGLLGGAAHIAMTLSFRYAEASVLAPFEYLTILWATSAGFLLFAEVPASAFLMAAPLVIAGAVVASTQEHRPAPKTRTAPQCNRCLPGPGS
ncbi:MAG: DMT family transporter [Pseudomonadota bacterium]